MTHDELVKRNHEQRAIRELDTIRIIIQRARNNPRLDYKTLYYESMLEADTVPQEALAAIAYMRDIEDEIAKHTDKFPND